MSRKRANGAKKLLLFGLGLGVLFIIVSDANNLLLAIMIVGGASAFGPV